MTVDDASRWAEVLAAGEEVDQRGDHYSAADLAEELADPEVDLSRDSLLVFDGDRPVAAQVLWTRGDTVHSDAMVHPSHRRRGIGAALLEVARRRAAELGAELQLRANENVPGQVALAEAAGMRPVRWWSDLHRPLTGPVEPVPLPAGLELHRLGPGYDAARWDGPLCAIRNATFAEHWGSTPETVEAFAHRRTGAASFRPACSVAATSADGTSADGTVVGFVLSDEHEEMAVRTGVRELYVATVGTLPGWRGRGLAGALLTRVLGWAQELGYHSSSLTVDADNATGALGVYTRIGYRLRGRDISYAAR